MSEFEERHHRLWHSGYDSTELEIITNPTLLRAKAWAAIDVARKRAEAEAAARKEEFEQRRYAQYIHTVGKSFNPHDLRIRIGAIQKAVCQHYGISRTQLLSDRRTAAIVWPRQVAIYLAKILTLKSYPAIARWFAGRDHSTIIHACDRVRSRMATDPDLADEVAHIRRTLEGRG